MTVYHYQHVLAMRGLYDRFVLFPFDPIVIISIYTRLRVFFRLRKILAQTDYRLDMPREGNMNVRALTKQFQANTNSRSTLLFHSLEWKD